MIKPHQCSLERFHVVSIELKLNFDQGLCLFRQKQIIKSSRHENLQDQNNEDFLKNITQCIK